MSKYTIIFAAIAGLVFALAPAAQAAVVTWEAPVPVGTVGDTVVNTTGVLVEALNFNGDTVTVDGVTFAGMPRPVSATAYSDFSAIEQYGDNNGTSSLPLIGPEFDDMLSTSVARSGSQTITLDGLTLGGDYIVQFFAYCPNTDWTQYYSSGGTQSTAAFLYTGPSQLATFTADAETLSVTIHQTYGRVSGYQQRLVPEPATLALLGIGGLGMLLRRRRRA